MNQQNNAKYYFFQKVLSMLLEHGAITQKEFEDLVQKGAISQEEADRTIRYNAEKLHPDPEYIR